MTARQTPWEVAFADVRWADEVFPAIRDAARASVARADVPDAFLMLDAVRAHLPELMAGDAPRGPSAEALLEYGALLFHGFRFWLHERPFFVLEDALARSLLERQAPLGAWRFAPPAPAGYLQLPRHLLWARVNDDAPAEPIDGFFWSVAGMRPGDEQPLQRLDLLLALGLHPDRPGFSIVAVTASLPAPAPGHFGDLQVRDAGDDFANILPGGDLRGLFGLGAVAEALKLASRAFHHLATQPQTVRPAARDRAGATPESFEMPPSTLAARRVSRERNG